MPFHFKQFVVSDDHSTQRVGTDAMLLGAWANPQDAGSILDIGTGCGVIALMVAQKTHASIDAIDIDGQSADQARHNFENSPWKSRLCAIHVSWQTFVENIHKPYDFIISNPPYFSRSLKSTVHRKNLARHNAALSLTEILPGADAILTSNGRLSVILPEKELTSLIPLAIKNNLYLKRKTLVIPKPSSKANRVLLEFSRSKTEKTIENTLLILDDQNRFTASYLFLTRDFHQFNYRI